MPLLTEGPMDRTNAERQRRYIARLKAKAGEAKLLEGKPKDVAERAILDLGVKRCRSIVRALDKLLRNIKPDCPNCNGSGVILADARCDEMKRLTAERGDTFIPMRFACPCAMEAKDRTEKKKPRKRRKPGVTYLLENERGTYKRVSKAAFDAEQSYLNSDEG